MRSYRFFTVSAISVLAILIAINTGTYAQSSKKNTLRKSANQSVKKNVAQQSSKKLDRAAKLKMDGQAVPKKKKSKATSSNKKLGNSGNSSSSAKKVERCQTDQYHQQRLQDPRYVDHLKSLADEINQSLSRGYIPCDANNTIVVPIAVHFDASVDCSNIQCIVDATQAQVNTINDDFAAANADLQQYNDIIANCGGTNVVSDGVCVTFCLATQNHPPSSGLVDGQPAITLGQYTGSFGAGGFGAPEWQGYLNIFAVNGFGGGVADGIGGALNGDGVTVGTGVFGGANFGPCTSGAVIDDGGGLGWDLGRTLTHEIGHYFGLYHTFQDGCADEPNVPYDVNDTPAQENPSGGVVPATNCAALATGCTIGEEVQMNFMDYFDDPSLVMFSNEQAIAMNTFANTNTWANDAVDTGCSDFSETCLVDCSVLAAFTPPDGANLIVCADDGSPIFLVDGSQLNDTWNWTFTVTGGDLTLSTSSSTMQTPDLTVEGGTSGTIEITLETCSNAGGDCGGCDTQTVTYNVTVASGAACPVGCDYTLELTDTYGDGWNGATLDIQGNGVPISGSPFGGSFTVGTSEIITITLIDGEVVTFNQTNGGFPGEEGFILTDPFGTVIFDASGGDVGAGEVLSFVAYCDPPVCDNDGTQSGFEGGVDCGGASGCPDCCGNGLQDDMEGGIDCGGDSPCADCCGNGIQDDLEGGIDCGGGSPCASCCGNGIQDDGETNVDCGGPNCVPCPSCPDGFLEVFDETFDACMQPAGWTVTTTGTGTIANGDFSFSAAPNGLPGGAAGPSADFGGCIALMDDDNDPANVGVHCIVTPVIDITAYINISLFFDWQHEEISGSIFNVEVFDGTNWVSVFNSVADENGSNEMVNLDAYTNAAFQIRFCYDDAGVWGWGFAIDNVSICGNPNDECPATVDATVVTGDYCDGSTIDLVATGNPNLTYAWSSSSTNVVIADPAMASTSASLSTTELCAPTAVDISAVITCNLDGVVLFDGVVSTVNIYPNPPTAAADLANYVDTDACAPIAGCENTITLTDDGAGGFAVVFAHAGGPDCCPDVAGATTELVVDGSFEAGPGAGTWIEASTNFGTPICDVGGCGTGTGTGPSDGNFWTWFGGVGASEIGSVCQDIIIPTGINSLVLTFDLEMIICDSASDFMEVTVDGTQIFFVDGSSALCGVLGYAPQSIDLLAAGVMMGSTVTLCFESEIFAANGDGSNFFVDNVSVLAEQPPGEDTCLGSVSCGACAEDISGAIIPDDPTCDVSGIDVTVTAPDGTIVTVTTGADGTFTVPGGPFPCGNYSATITTLPGDLPACYADSGPVGPIAFTVDGDPSTSDGPFFEAQPTVPTLSQWGLISLALLLMILGSVKLAIRSRAFATLRK